MTKPSTTPAKSERVIVCQRGRELADVAELLTQLGAQVEVVSGPLPALEKMAAAALVVISGQRLGEQKSPPVRRWRRTLAIVDDAGKTLSAHLARIGVGMIVRRPIDPRTLRLILLHELYRGPERRVKRRVMIGQSIRAGVGLFKQAATLLELSRTGARIGLPNPPRPGSTIQLVLGKELTGSKPIKAQARVVRVIGGPPSASANTSEIGVSFIDPKAELALPLQTILDRYSNGVSLSPVVGTSPRSPGDVSATRPATPALREAPARAASTASAVRPSSGIRPPGDKGAVAQARTSASRPTPPGGASRAPRSGAIEPEIRRLPPSFSPDVVVAASSASARLPEPADSPAPSPSPPPTVEIASPSFTPDASGICVDVITSDAFFEPLEGDESDLDFELELDDELTFEPLGPLPGDETNPEASHPEASESENDGGDRRGAARVPYARRVVALDEQAARVVVGRDLSYGGLRIEANPDLAIGDVLKLALHAGIETEPLVVLAAIERDEGERGLVLVFAELTSGQRERLEKILAASSSIESARDGDAEGADGIIVGELLGRAARDPRPRSAPGFTIIELMIVVSILGVIASVAIPIFNRHQLRAQSSEVKTNLGAIRVVEESSFAEVGRYLAAAAEPPIVPGPQPTDFEIVGSDFAELGWSPEGRVYFSYAVATAADEAGYTADAAADIDGDGILQLWGYSKPDPLGALTPGGQSCDPNLLEPEEVGPCSAGATAF